MLLKKTHTKFLVSCIILLCVSGNASAQDLSKYQALFITKFISYVNWSGKPDNLTIGVVGNSRVLIELQSSLKTRGKKSTVKKIANPADATSCDVLFIPANQSKLFASINSNTAGKHLLIMTETVALAEQGSVITFYTEGDKLRFIINQAAADARGLQISSALLVMAKVI